MNKIVLGIALGGALGILDGLTSWFTPEVRSGIVGIVFGSTFKGIIAGVLIGVFARKVKSLPLGIVFAGLTIHENEDSLHRTKETVIAAALNVLHPRRIGCAL